MAKKRLPKPYDVIFMEKKIHKMEAFISEQMKLSKTERNHVRVAQYKLDCTTYRRWCKDRMIQEPQLSQEREEKRMQRLLTEAYHRFDFLDNRKIHVGYDYGNKDFSTSLMYEILESRMDGKTRIIDKAKPISIAVVPHGLGKKSFYDMQREMKDQFNLMKIPLPEISDEMKAAAIKIRQNMMGVTMKLRDMFSPMAEKVNKLLNAIYEKRQCTWVPITDEVWNECEMFCLRQTITDIFSHVENEIYSKRAQRVENWS